MQKRKEKRRRENRRELRKMRRGEEWGGDEKRGAERV